MYEDEDLTTPSKHGHNGRVEELYDYICSEIGFDNKELREAIRLYGKLRFNEGVRLTMMMEAGRRSMEDQKKKIDN